MNNFYPIITIDDDAPELPEQQGTKTKYWLHQDNELYLFKIGRPNTGENWAEKVACELCELLGLPHAHYELAQWKQHKGVITKSIRPTNSRLIMGNELLSRVFSTYPAEQKYKVTEHTLRRITARLSNKNILTPLNWIIPSEDIEKAIDVFLGYLLLDTWIANQDRHHENWAVINHEGNIYLAPTYDHAASLGQNETDEKRKMRLTTKDKGQQLEHYIKKARSAIYLKKSDNKPLLTLEVFNGLAKERPKAAKVWLEKLNRISLEQCELIFNRIPPTEISNPAKEFAIQLLILNKRRLLEQ